MTDVSLNCFRSFSRATHSLFYQHRFLVQWFTVTLIYFFSINECLLRRCNDIWCFVQTICSNWNRDSSNTNNSHLEQFFLLQWNKMHEYFLCVNWLNMIWFKTKWQKKLILVKLIMPNYDFLYKQIYIQISLKSTYYLFIILIICCMFFLMY